MPDSSSCFTGAIAGSYKHCRAVLGSAQCLRWVILTDPAGWSAGSCPLRSESDRRRSAACHDGPAAILGICACRVEAGLSGGRSGKFRIDPDRLVIVGDGAVVVALGSVRIASVVVDRRIFRVEPDCLVIIGNRAVVVRFGLGMHCRGYRRPPLFVQLRLTFDCECRIERRAELRRYAPGDGGYVGRRIC